MTNNNYILIQPPKSVALGLVLSFIFGPLGLLYSSVKGGIIMFFSPVVLFFIILSNISGGNEITGANVVAVLFSSFFLMLFMLFSWVVCMIWSVIAVYEYNIRIINETHALNNKYNNKTKHLSTSDDEIRMMNWLKQDPKRTVEGFNKQFGGNGSITEWLKSNPTKNINDYYKQAL